MSVLTRFAGLAKVLTVFVVLALIAAVVLVFARNDMKRTLTVDFPSTNSLYKGSDVRILGVPVGEVEELKAEGDHIQVTLTYDTDVRLPTDVKAVIISPAIVGDRFVQLAPAYSGGPVLPDNAKLGIDRSEVPVELDEIFESLDNLSVALGPKGANKDGSLSSLVEDSAAQLKGQGRQLNVTLSNFAKLSTTLSNNKDEIFASVDETEQLIALLNRNDASVRRFFDSTTRVSRVLEAERDDLAKTLKFLGRALIDVRRLIKDNRTTLRHNVDNLQRLARVLARHNREIEHTLIDAPVALGDLGLAGGSSKTGTLDARADLGKTFGDVLTNPGALPNLLCQVFFGNEAIPGGQQLCPALKDLLKMLLPAGFGTLAATAPEGQKAEAAAEPQAPAPQQSVQDLIDLLGVNP